MKAIKKEFKIKSSVKSVWEALTKTRIINKWGGPSKMKPLEGTKFFLWGGDIHGVNTKVVPEKELRQDWMAGKWDKYSKVTFKLKEKGDATVISLTHTDIPPTEHKDLSDGWENSYFGAIKKLLEHKI